MIVAPGWSVLSFSSESVAGDVCRWSCRLFLTNLVIVDVVLTLFLAAIKKCIEWRL